MRTILKVIGNVATAAFVAYFVTVCSLFLLFFLWMATKAIPGNPEFGYYGEFNRARKAILRSTCADTVEYARHEDLTLEDFHFKVRTRSGLIVRLWFREEMDARQVCSAPEGLLVRLPRRSLDYEQGYSMRELARRLGANNEIRDLNDVLCNIDALATVFSTNYDNSDIPRITYTDAEYDRYLRVEIMHESRGNEFAYSPAK